MLSKTENDLFLGDTKGVQRKILFLFFFLFITFETGQHLCEFEPPGIKRKPWIIGFQFNDGVDQRSIDLIRQEVSLIRIPEQPGQAGGKVIFFVDADDHFQPPAIQ